MVADEIKEKVRQATDIAALIGEHVQLQPRGRDLWGCCPFHEEKSPSFHVRPDMGTWKCFGCGKGGDCFTYVMEHEHLDFPDALRLLAERAGIELPEQTGRSSWSGKRIKRDRLLAAMDAATEFYHRQLTRSRDESAAAARAYMAKRGFGSEVAAKWRLGFAPGGGKLVSELAREGFTNDEMITANLASRSSSGKLRDVFFNRVVFPIRDESGRVVAFGARVLDGSHPKYINTSDTPIYTKGKTLFAFDMAKTHIAAQLEAVVMEGYTDVIASHEAGIQNVVAALGTSFTIDHFKRLSDFLTGGVGKVARGKIVCLFDGDEAGLKAAESAFQFVSTTTAGMYCVVLPEGKDPAEYIEAYGADALRERIAQYQPLAKFVIDRHLERFDLSSPEQRVSALADVASAMVPLKGSALADTYVEYAASFLQCDVATMRQALAQARPLRPVTQQSVPSVAVQQTLDQAQRQTVTAAEPKRLLPKDARMAAVERRFLSMLANRIDLAREFTDRIASIQWCDPRHEAIAWALLASPEGTTAKEALGIAESVCDDAASILADGMDEVATAADGRSLDILLDDLEMRSLKRRINQGRAELRVANLTESEDALRLFGELTELQRRLHELEAKVRTVS